MTVASIDINPAFGHHFLKLPQAQRIGNLPANASQDRIERKMQTF
jgi:hypothetical protein